jgi:hypothetical protein
MLDIVKLGAVCYKEYEKGYIYFFEHITNIFIAYALIKRRNIVAGE